MTQYRHQAKYYETDQMGIIHHSNYIRWMEEARIDLMDEIGFSYRKMEEIGIISPVLSVQCEYKNRVHFDDTVLIEVDIKQYKWGGCAGCHHLAGTLWVCQDAPGVKATERI